MTEPIKIDLTLDFGQTQKTYTLQGSINSQGLNLNFDNNGKPTTLDLDFSNFKLGHCPPKPFKELVVFGDSFSDTGTIFNLTGQVFPPSPPYFEGRFSNGPIWVDFLAPELGIKEKNVKNFAVGGATTGRENINSTQIGNQSLPGLLTEIDTYSTQVGSSGANPKALYIVWAGGNDFLQIAERPQDAPSVIQQAVTNLSTAITTLFNLGARQIVVPNQLNFGLTPLVRDRGLSDLATQATIGFNQALDQGIDQLEQTLGIDLIEVDLFGLGQRIAAAPAEFGFSNISDRLITQTNPANPAGYLWWDDVHPTTQGHQLVAETIETAISAARRPTGHEVFNSSNLFEAPITLAARSPLSV
ncbi:SGNH/GDSL hydrolase family protein [Leptolyngbya sp. NIES-2104]|uniref:SGNH/GDSL hydrolase family protein n=1 Tax=Leptolyngbya sp. NIES-2104 TaxID=1552121 RepID=UPI0006ECBB45|nr:SGNH/GDSL hydrolase family protein [Leptolyngbya sp. NIES-2104]GAP94235.1 phospholipase/lecithinase/hemolysin [Leptolyngbya sp. NIES-2104]